MEGSAGSIRNRTYGIGKQLNGGYGRRAAGSLAGDPPDIFD